MDDFNTITDSYNRHLKALATANLSNKTAVFDALAAANITAVTVEFDGEGDNGQIGDISGFNGKLPAEFPATSIDMQRTTWNGEESSTSSTSLRDAIETLCFDYLEQEHGGWENNDGGCGTFDFDTANRTISLEFNQRYSDYTIHSHEF